MGNKVVLLCLLVGLALTGELRFDGRWGNWEAPTYVPDGYFLCGAQMRFEDYVGNGDDTATNGFNFKFCRFTNWDDQIVRTYQGRWGTWKDWAMCPKGYFVVGFQVRFQGDQGNGDDTAFNGLKFLCRDSTFGVFFTSVYEGRWGDWYPWQAIPDDKSEYINGFQIRFQPNQGNGDDTALNGLIFKTKQFKISFLKFNYIIPETYSLLPRIVDSQIVNNGLHVPVKKTVQFAKSVTVTKKWENFNRFLLNVEASGGMDISVPFVDINMKIAIKTQYQRTFRFSEQFVQVLNLTQNLQVECPPCSTCYIRQMIKQSNIDIPYTVEITFQNGDRQTINGLYQGVLFSQSYDQISKRPYTTACLAPIVQRQSAGLRKID